MIAGAAAHRVRYTKNAPTKKTKKGQVSVGIFQKRTHLFLILGDAKKATTSR